MISEADIYPLIGDDGFTRLIAAFYRRVPTDPILAPMYTNADLTGAEWRLRMFLIGRFNGPPVYIQERGHPRLRMRHDRFKVDRAAAERWLKLMAEAMAEAKLPADVQPILWDYFQNTAVAMINQAG
jgi:hemoglobin